MHPKLSGAGGNWRVIDEVTDPAIVQQQSIRSCGSACGEMLLQSRGINNISQADIEKLATAPTWPELLADALNQLNPDNQGKWLGNFVSASSFDALNATGSWIGVLWGAGARIGHTVVVDGIYNDTVLIRDPWDGTKYRMRKGDFLEYWNGQAVYWIEQ
ncbi:cysteine peptidase family C39 domain-containing protein [Argonema galeatum]|uniref:cysteine peptidase family C39 domain-containing protein n=2 Tax=Argonema TaxID=2942761 RepID=UPI0020136AA8|nr:papain-like cysteine protease family protein [Argonema galeatum]MCL1465533.1 hypothetical protein [Argonema galeatum A003/A1]